MRNQITSITKFLQNNSEPNSLQFASVEIYFEMIQTDTLIACRPTFLWSAAFPV